MVDTVLFYVCVLIIVLVVIIIILYWWLTDELSKIHIENPDIIIIGGGVAGSVITRRLSDKYKDKTILLLEQGLDRRNERAVYRVENSLNIAYTEPYSKTVPTDSPNVVSTFATMMGGGSSHNYGLVVQGTRDYYTNWQDKFLISDENMDGYIRNVYDKIQVTPVPPTIDIKSRIWPIVKLLMAGHLEEVKQAIDVFINIGPLRVNEQLNNDLIESLRVGYTNMPVVNNYNDVSICVTPTQFLYIDPVTGVRSSINRQYLPKEYHNLEVRVKSEVTHVNLDDLSVTVNGGVVKAKEKLVISCGGVFTPYLLYKSGLELPTTLKNHYGTQMIMAIKTDEFASGPLAFLPERDDGTERDWQVITVGSPLTNLSFLQKQGIDTEGLRKGGWTFLTFLVFLLNPKSTGNIDYENYKINLNMFHPEDEVNLILAMKHLTKSFEYISDKYEVDLLYPSKDDLYGSDLDLLKAIKTGVATTEHHSCTMRDHINENMELSGYKNVHIVDTSIFPEIPNGNTEFPSIMIGEIAADLIYR